MPTPHLQSVGGKPACGDWDSTEWRQTRCHPHCSAHSGLAYRKAVNRGTRSGIREVA